MYTSKRLFTAVLSLCIPIIISDRIQLPFTHELRWERFTLRLPEKAVINGSVNVVQFAQSIPPSTVHELQCELWAARPLLIFDASLDCGSSCSALVPPRSLVSRRTRQKRARPESWGYVGAHGCDAHAARNAGRTSNVGRKAGRDNGPPQRRDALSALLSDLGRAAQRDRPILVERLGEAPCVHGHSFGLVTGSPSGARGTNPSRAGAAQVWVAHGCHGRFSMWARVHPAWSDGGARRRAGGFDCPRHRATLECLAVKCGAGGRDQVCWLPSS